MTHAVTCARHTAFLGGSAGFCHDALVLRTHFQCGHTHFHRQEHRNNKTHTKANPKDHTNQFVDMCLLTGSGMWHTPKHTKQERLFHTTPSLRGVRVRVTSSKHHQKPIYTIEIWLILPVVICLFQGLSHACLRITAFAEICAWLITSDAICRKNLAVPAYRITWRKARLIREYRMPSTHAACRSEGHPANE